MLIPLSQLILQARSALWSAARMPTETWRNRFEHGLRKRRRSCANTTARRSTRRRSYCPRLLVRLCGNSYCWIEGLVIFYYTCHDHRYHGGHCMIEKSLKFTLTNFTTTREDCSIVRRPSTYYLPESDNCLLSSNSIHQCTYPNTYRKAKTWKWCVLQRRKSSIDMKEASARLSWMENTRNRSV